MGYRTSIHKDHVYDVTACDDTKIRRTVLTGVDLETAWLHTREIIYQFASAACISRHKADRLIAFEKEFGSTLKRDTDLASLIAKGRPYKAITPELARLATAFEYTEPVIVPKDGTWFMPSGAFTKCQ